MIVNGTRATAKTLGINKGTVTNALKSIEALVWYVNYEYINTHQNSGITAEIVPVNEAEMDEMGSFVGDKSPQYGLWWAIDHHSGEPPAFHFGTGEHKNHDEVLGLLKSFDITIVYGDDTFAYKTHVTKSEVVTGKEKTQKIERNHVSLRSWCSRLVRKGIRFSKEPRHKMVVALVINFWFFLRIVW